MGYPRSHIVDPLRSGIYHCISRCVRRESLLQSAERCSWIIKTLERLCRSFAVDVCDFAVMRNHVHLLLRTHPELAMAWSDREVARRWLGRDGNSTSGLEAEVDAACGDPSLIEDWRARLSDLGWFHKLWKEPAAKAWNREDDVTGHFWEGRFHSIGCQDETSVLMQAVYIVLNPVHCGLELRPGESGRTSLTRRISKLRMEIERGHVHRGVEAYRLALLEPAIPCDPGSEAPQLADPEWAERLSRRMHARAIREEAVAHAYRSVRLARRPIVIAEGTSGSKRSSDAVQDPSTIERQLVGCPRGRPRRDPVRVSSTRAARTTPTVAESRVRNPWRGGSPLSMIADCTLVAFIDIVDERSRLPRADKACHVPWEHPRLLDCMLIDPAGCIRTPGSGSRSMNRSPLALANDPEPVRVPRGSWRIRD